MSLQQSPTGIRPPRRVSHVFGQLYVTCAALGVVAIFVPLYAVDPARATTSSIASYSLWRGLVEFAEPIASVAIVLVLVLIGLLLWSAHRPEAKAPPAAVLVLAMLGLLLTLGAPGRPSAALDGPGHGLLIGLCLILVASSVTHLVLLLRWGR